MAKAKVLQNPTQASEESNRIKAGGLNLLFKAYMVKRNITEDPETLFYLKINVLPTTHRINTVFLTGLLASD